MGVRRQKCLKTGISPQKRLLPGDKPVLLETNLAKRFG